MVGPANQRPRIIVTTDVNGTTTPDNTFGELVRVDGLFDEMDKLMKGYTSGACKFSRALPKMNKLASGVDRGRLESYAEKMPLFMGVTETFDKLVHSETVDARVALSTTGFAGLMALVNKFRHGFSLSVAASPVLAHLLSEEEKSCLIRPIVDEEDKIHVLDDLADMHRPNSNLLFHVGDTIGDFAAIRHAAELGGAGIAFNPNEALKLSISNLSTDLRHNICEIDFTDGEEPDYNKVRDVIAGAVWKTLRTEL